MKSSAPAQWTVGQVAERFDLPTNVLRHWESVGLITPERDSADRRRYGPDDVVRIAVIQRSKAAGMSLEQIATLLDSESPGRHKVLEEHIAEIDRTIEEMRLSRAMTEHALRCQAHDIAQCPRFRSHLDDLLAGF
ncbi:DNA-binding transcriptional MerR regulator [Nocardioides daedukensis]|uniref:DNA-binding transcriptional MerR regulator n=1 Tax=Nocardioides daedukensis TaxID=634462 RepID=A0A7Y9S1P7_9ACTN|nr:MerR family transcriptional regulator [Nocardioides daedukensis]NYG58862.1 DNA-binding transcriptional MerR regulator [Nocardioides daedukensis]